MKSFFDKGSGLWVWGVLFLSSAVYAESPETAVKQTLKAYAAAIESMDITRVEQFVVTSRDFSVFENGHVNLGWLDYRDHHLAPELKAFQSIEYRYEDINVRAADRMAFAALKYRLAIALKDRRISGKGLATIVLQKHPEGWKILHIHTTRIPETKK